MADVPRLARFYSVVASMAVLHEDDAHVVLETEGFQLVIHALRGEPDPSGTTGGPAIREDSYIKVCLPVERIAAARNLAQSLGGGLQPPEREWEARGFRACDGFDPEGNVFQLRQAARG